MTVIRAKWNPFLVRLFYFYARTMLSRQFMGIHVKNGHLLQQGNPNYPTLCFANHCNWWDGLVDFILIQRLLPQVHFYIMVEELKRLPLLAYMGGFSIEKMSPKTILESLNYAIALLKKDHSSVLWVYPQGKVEHQEVETLCFGSGISYLVKHLPHVNLVPVAQYYTFLLEDRPEVFINIGTPFSVEQLSTDRHALTHAMEAAVTAQRENLRSDIRTGQLQSYQTLLKGHINPYKQLEQSLHPFRGLFTPRHFK